MFLHNCSTLQKSMEGTWKLSSVINSDDIYANRSSLTSEKVESEMTISLKKNGTFTSTGNLCTGGWEKIKDNYTEGKFYMPKYMKLDKTFRLEATECPGIGGQHHIKLVNKKLELYYPSATGYRIQIFEKQTKK